MTQVYASADPALLAQKIGHIFVTPRLLEEALTHPSLAAARSRKAGMPYERLEFLGDRVLGLIIAEWLYEAFPTATEGELAKRHAGLVNRDALRLVAQGIELDRFVRLAPAKKTEEGRTNLAAQSDALEALIGAVYLDGGYTAARAFIRRYWHGALSVHDAPADPKTALQEWAQGKGLPLPAYRVVDHSGPAHAPRFKVELRVKGYPPVEAEGDSKRAAQKEAAIRLLEKLDGRGDESSVKKRAADPAAL